MTTGTTAAEDCATLCAIGFNSLLAGDVEFARELFSRSVAQDPGYPLGYLGLAKCRLPGPGYIEVLRRLIALVRPARYVEIGVERGAVLGLFPSSTRVVGIDPEPKLRQLPDNVTVYDLPSDDFFAAYNLAELLGGTYDLAFIDGLHEFRQVLRDFINLERFSGPESVLLIHDCLPLDRRTAAPERETVFWTGDVWKIIACLKNERPDLGLFTIPAYPAGLCVVTGLKADNLVLADNYSRLAEKYRALDYDAIGAESDFFSLVANRWPEIAARLRELQPGRGPADERGE